MKGESSNWPDLSPRLRVGCLLPLSNTKVPGFLLGIVFTTVSWEVQSGEHNKHVVIAQGFCSL